MKVRAARGRRPEERRRGRNKTPLLCNPCSPEREARAAAAMITRRASVATQKRPDVSRASFVHVVVPRTEQRCAEGEKRPHSVYLVRLLSHLGDYPTTDTFYELRYSRVAELHTHLRAEHPGLRLPWLPRARWLGSKHPAYVSEMREEIERYLRQLLTHWLRSYGGFDSFIMLLHAAHHGEPLPPPPDIPQNRRGSSSSGEPSFAPTTPASSRTPPPQRASPSLDTEALVSGLSWREYQERTAASPHLPASPRISLHLPALSRVPGAHGDPSLHRRRRDQPVRGGGRASGGAANPNSNPDPDPDPNPNPNPNPDPDPDPNPNPNPNPNQARPLHLWRVENFSVARLPAEAEARAGLTLRSR